jgi:hypothetical protein
MPLTAVYNAKPQNQGTKHANKDQGGAPQLPESGSVVSNASPARGVVSGANPGDFRAGAAHPASVLGTGNNPDRLVLTGEAV